MVGNLKSMELTLLNHKFNKRGNYKNRGNGTHNPKLRSVNPGQMSRVGENMNADVRSFQAKELERVSLTPGNY